MSVTAGSTNRQDVGLTADIYTLSKFVVSGEREGNALAITLQRNSTGVRNVVSADAFGSLDGNPADLLVRLPGVSGTTQDGDFRFVQIRGMSQQPAIGNTSARSTRLKGVMRTRWPIRRIRIVFRRMSSEFTAPVGASIPKVAFRSARAPIMDSTASTLGIL